MVSLDFLKTGDSGKIRIINGKQNFLSRISGIGFSLNEKIEMLQNNKRGPVIVSLRGSEIALGRNEASSILIDLRRKE